MIWTDLIEMHEFERRGWLYPDEVTLVYRTDCDRRTARLERRVELERHRTDAVYFLALRCSIEDDADRRRLSLDELVYGNVRAMHELVALRVELDKLRARVVDSDLERGRISQQAAEMKACVWAEDCDGGWETLCGGQFELTSGTPQSNGMAYCCYCGGSLKQIEYTGEAERAAIAATPKPE